jgi:hypothetical protein
MLAEEPNPDLGELVQIALDIAGSLEPREVIARILERGTHGGSLKLQATEPGKGSTFVLRLPLATS